MACGKAQNRVAAEKGHEGHYCHKCVGYHDISCAQICMVGGECYFEPRPDKEPSK
jgi:hypothetical protein